MAVMIRTSTWMGVLPPTRSMTFSWRPGGASSAGWEKRIDIVQEDGAAVGLLKFSLLIPDGPGESPPHVPEELALQQGLRQGAATDLAKGPFPPGGVVMDVSGQHGFAGAGLPGDEDRGHGIGDGVDQLQELIHLPVADTPGSPSTAQGLRRCFKD